MRQQKRQHKRYIKRCTARFGDSDDPSIGISSDFSASGLFIRTTRPMPVGSVIDIYLDLPDGRISKVRGEVVRSSRASGKWYAGKKISMSSEKEGMGIRIMDHDEQFSHFLKTICR